MPPKARIDAAGTLHPIIVHGIERRKIFCDDEDRDSFIKRLGQVLPETHTEGDERILGDGDFVKAVLDSCRQQLERRHQYLAQGYDFNWLVDQVANLLSLDQQIVTRRGRYPDTVEARSVFCCWAAGEPGISTLALTQRLGISQPMASQSVKRGGAESLNPAATYAWVRSAAHRKLHPDLGYKL